MAMIIRQINPTGYLHYKQIPNWFKVESIYEVQAPINGLGGLHFYEHKLENPYIKRYSMVQEKTYLPMKIKGLG